MKQFLIILLSIVFFETFAQNLDPSILKAQIIETPKGYLIYGFDKTNFILHAYDKELNRTNSIEVPAHKQTNPYYLSSKKIEDNYHFSAKNFSLLVDESGNKKKMKTWSKSLHQKLLLKQGKEGKDLYFPIERSYERAFSNNHIFFENSYLQVISSRIANAPFNNKYKSTPKIRLFNSAESENFAAYKLNWEVDLEFNTIDIAQWFNFGKDNLYLYVTGDNSKRMLYKININSKKVIFKYNLIANSSERFELSNLTLDDQKNIIIVGINSLKSEENNFPFVSYGWGIYKINPNGELISKKEFPFKKHQLIKYKNQEENEDDLKYKYINFNKINYVNNKIILIGENIRLVKKELITSSLDYSSQARPGATVNSSSTGWISQRYGFSYFEISEELEEINSNFIPQLYVSSKNKLGSNLTILTTQKKVSNIDALVLFSNKHNLYTSNSPEKIQLNIEDDYYSPPNTIIITKEKDEKGLVSFYKTYVSTKKDKEFINSCKSDLDSELKYFLQSTELSIEFFSNKKGYFISKVSL